MEKEMILETINGLSDKADIIDVIENLYIRMKVEDGLKDVKHGNIISHKQLKEEIANW